MTIPVALPRVFTDQQVEELDPYAFSAVVGKKVIHPGGRRAIERLIARADFAPGQLVLDVRCDVGTTTIEIAKRFGATVIAADIAPLMLDWAAANVRSADIGHFAVVDPGDICNLRFEDASFDRVMAEAVTIFLHRTRAARELVRARKPGGRVSVT